MKKYLLSELSTKKIAGIYKINFPNGKIYIGQSQNIYKRILEHNSYARAGHGNHKLQLCELAIKKYGQIQEVEILEEVIDLTLLDKLETYYINLYDSTNKEKGYNIVQEGDAAGKRGCDNINSNFTPEQLEEIIYLLQNNLKMSYKDIAEKFNVSSDCIYKICAGIT